MTSKEGGVDQNLSLNCSRNTTVANQLGIQIHDNSLSSKYIKYMHHHDHEECLRT